MDDSGFDDLTRRLGGATTRRAGLRAALGGLLGMATGLSALPAADSSAKKKKKKRNVLCPAVCPSGSACIDGACTCTRELCGGECCDGYQTCLDGRCMNSGLRDCTGVAIVDGADLSHCNLAGATIPIRTLRNANFEGADLTGARFTGQFQPWGCSFKHARLAYASLFECDIKPGTTFEGANLREADLQAGHIDGADFSSAMLTQARFGHPDNAVAKGTWITNSRFAWAHLAGANLKWAHIHDSDFSKADLSDANLWIIDIGQTDLSGATLAGADLRGAKIVDAALDGALLDRAKVGEAYASGFYSTRFVRSSMVNAGMRDLQPHVRESKATLLFSSVDLRNATFSVPYPRDRVAWKHVDLTGASGWQQPAGGYAYLCDVTLPDGSKAPNTSMPPGLTCP